MQSADRHWLITVTEEEFAGLENSQWAVLELLRCGEAGKLELLPGEQFILYRAELGIFSGVFTVEQVQYGPQRFALGECEELIPRLIVSPDQRPQQDSGPDVTTLLPYLRLSLAYPPQHWNLALSKPTQRISTGDFEFLRYQVKRVGS